jgi:trk system potassium uptake protein TrkA
VAKVDGINAYNKEMLKRDMVNSVCRYIDSMDQFKRIQLMEGQILCEIEVPGAFVGKTLQELDIRGRFGTEVVLIKQNFNAEKNEKKYVITAQPDYHFEFGDSILIMGSEDSLNKIQELG